MILVAFLQCYFILSCGLFNILFLFLAFSQFFNCFFNQAVITLLKLFVKKPFVMERRKLAYYSLLDTVLQTEKVYT